MPQSRVYIVQEPLRRTPNGVIPRIDYSTLTPFGKLEFLFTWGEIKDEDALLNTSRFVEQLRDRLDDFDDDDYLVCLGNPVLVGLAIAVAAECNNGRVRVLDWMRNSGKYRMVQVDLDAEEPTSAATAPALPIRPRASGA
jgi:hypothetical protein